MKLIRISAFVLAALAFTFSLAVCAQAQTYSDLANFDGTNGAGSNIPLIQATDGNFYGASGADTSCRHCTMRNMIQSKTCARDDLPD